MINCPYSHISAAQILNMNSFSWEKNGAIKGLENELTTLDTYQSFLLINSRGCLSLLL